MIKIQHVIIFLSCFCGLAACASSAIIETHKQQITFKDDRSDYKVVWDIAGCGLSYRSSKKSDLGFVSKIYTENALKVIDGEPNTYAMPVSVEALHKNWEFKGYLFKVTGERKVKVSGNDYPVYIIEKSSVEPDIESEKFFYSVQHGILGFAFEDGSTAVVKKIPDDIFLNCQQKPVD